MPRGRPRKPNPDAWLEDIPDWIKRLPPCEVTGNILRSSKQHAETMRRENVGWGVRKAYAAGRNQANTDRAKEKKARMIDLYQRHTTLILRHDRSASWVAHRILLVDPGCGLLSRTLRSYVKELRKLAGPNSPEK